MLFTKVENVTAKENHFSFVVTFSCQAEHCNGLVYTWRIEPLLELNTPKDIGASGDVLGVSRNVYHGKLKGLCQAKLCKLHDTQNALQKKKHRPLCLSFPRSKGHVPLVRASSIIGCFDYACQSKHQFRFRGTQS